jgi:hypothetical protein
MKTKDITLTAAEIEAMPSRDLVNLLMRATKVTGTAAVRRADGSIKYDEPSKLESVKEI